MLHLASVKALTFDCYGTLIDWETGILRCVGSVLASHGVRPPDEDILTQYALAEADEEAGPYRPYRAVLDRVMRRLAANFGVVLNEGEERALSSSIGGWEAYPDTRDSLRALGAHYRLGVCSNIDDDLFEATRPRLGVEELLERVVTAAYCRSYKPDPRHFRVALALLDLGPQEVLHVAQSRYHDIAPARRLGMRTCWVDRPSKLVGRGVTPHTPVASEPDIRTTDLASLLAILRAG